MSLFPFIFTFCIIAYLYLGFFSIMTDKKATLNRMFFYACVLLAICSFSNASLYLSPNKDIAWIWYKIATYTGTFALVLVCDIFFEISEVKKEKLKWLLTIISYIFCIVSSTTFLNKQEVYFKKFWHEELLYSLLYSSASSINLYWLFIVFIIIVPILGIIMVLKWSKNTRSLREKEQAKIILICSSISYFLCLINLVLHMMKNYNIPIVYCFLCLIWASGIWYITVKLKFITITSAVAAEEILARVKDLIILIYPDLSIFRVNSKIEQLLGFKNDKLVGKSIYSIIFEEKIIKEEFIKLNKSFKNPNFYYFGDPIEINYKTLDNKIVPVKVTISPLKETNGDMLGIAIIGQDLRNTKHLKQEIIQRRIIENDLRGSNERLKELDKLKTDFLSTMSHELRTPLTSILGFSKIINKKLSTTLKASLKNKDAKAQKTLIKIEENVEIIISEGERLTNLINDVLDIAKMEEGKIDWRMQLVSVEDIMERAIGATTSLFQQKNIKVIKEFGDKIPKVIGDMDRLMQVCINLISNAIKFTDKGTVICRVNNLGDKVIVSVIDDGIGIDKNDVHKIFEKFKQVGNVLTDKPQGTGLGLSISKQIVEYHNGEIWAESILGKGSTFSFSIPLINTENDENS